MATSFAQQATLARESPVFQEPQEPLYKRTLDLSLVIGAHLLLLPVNVLKGEISLVGPRPVVEEELPKYGQWGPWLLSVKPGLTGLWQVLRHDELDYTRRISLDMHYIEHRSLRLDLEILLRTLPSVLARRGAY